MTDRKTPPRRSSQAGKGSIKPAKFRVATGTKSASIPRVPLRTVEHVRVQMAKLFREAKSGKLPTGDASRLCYLLGQLRVTIESASLENRVHAAEGEIAKLVQRLETFKR